MPRVRFFGSTTVRRSGAVLAGALVAALVAVPAPNAAAHQPAVIPVPASPDLIGADVIASSQSNEPRTAGGSANVNALDRSAAGFSVLAWTLLNEGTGTIPTAWFYSVAYLYSGVPFSGITLLAPEQGLRFYPLMDADQGCLCSAGYGNPPEFVGRVGSNSYSTYWSTYLLPEDVETVTVEIPGFAPIEDVPVSDV